MSPSADPAVLRAQSDLDAAVRHAAELLRAGGLVAFPTETVYGLGADARDPQAVSRIFAAKGRPADNPLIVHIPGVEHLGAVAAEVTPLARSLAERHWPGPLTLVLTARRDIPTETTGGLSTVGVRVPAHPVALALLRAAGIPVAAPSANRSGRPSPTTAAHVLADLGAAVEAVLDGGTCAVGVESTVVDARGPLPVILREGAVPRELLTGARSGIAPELGASPGTRYRHYAPACAVEVVPAGEGPRRAAALQRAGRRAGLVARAAAPGAGAPTVVEIGRFTSPEELARMLYRWLRDAEDARVDVLVVEAVAEAGIGRAVMDRLRRAASG
jgi:L-threonylcarbamoyladenylate synthase